MGSRTGSLAFPLLLFAAAGFVTLIVGCDDGVRPEDDDYNCPVLDKFPANDDINYKNLSPFSSAGSQTYTGNNVSAFVERVSTRAEDFEGEYRFFKALDQLIHESGYIPNPKPKDINELISRRSADEILSNDLTDASGRIVYSGCHDIAIVARSALISIGYDVVFVDSVESDFLEGGPFSGHTFLEIHDPYNHSLFLYDPTAGKIYRGYDPNSYTLPGDYLAFAKGLDSWSMSITSVGELSVCLKRYRDEFYNTSPATTFQHIDYREIDLN